MNMLTVLAVDDDAHVLHLIESALAELDTRLLTADSAETAFEIIADERPDLVIIENVLPNLSGLEALDRIRHDDPRLPVIIMSGEGSGRTTIEAMKRRADDFIAKPLDLNVLVNSVRRSLAHLGDQFASVEMCTVATDSSISVGMLICKSQIMQEVLKSIGRVAAQDLPVLIQGESGTGKELVANAIWQHSERASNIFLAVNCAALPETILESELFGHEKGAFTGAESVRKGKFEQCDGGTLFLDEVGDMSLNVQAKVLRLLQEQSFQRLGGTKVIKTNVRVISATNCDLDKMCAEGSFRQDLYFRLNGYALRLPPLRDRGNDIELLIEHFVKKISDKLGKQIDEISTDAFQALVHYDWPGNIRELQTTLSRAVLDARTTRITLACIPVQARYQLSHVSSAATLSLPRADGPSTPASQTVSQCDVAELLQSRLAANSHALHAEAIEYVERFVISEVLVQFHGNQSQAATHLGISRGSLRHKIRALGLMIDTSVSHQPNRSVVRNA